MEKFKVDDGKLVVSGEDGVEWETAGKKEFQEFYNIVCNIPHIRALADTNHNLSLLPHSSNIILKKFKTRPEYWRPVTDIVRYKSAISTVLTGTISIASVTLSGTWFGKNHCPFWDKEP